MNAPPEKKSAPQRQRGAHNVKPVITAMTGRSYQPSRRRATDEQRRALWALKLRLKKEAVRRGRLFGFHMTSREAGGAESTRAQFRQPRAPSLQESPPHSIDAEQGVLGSILQSPLEAIAECIGKITVDHFFVPAHRTIYQALLDCWDSGEAIDLITFTQHLRDRNLLDAVGGAAFVTSLFTFVPTAANIAYYLDIVREKYMRRECIAAATELVRRAYHEQDDEPEVIFDALESKLASIRSLHGQNGARLPPIDDASNLIANKIDLPNDVISGVLHRGGKQVLGGASKTYKTWLLIDTALSVATGTEWLGKFATKPGRVLYINLEIQSAFFAKRLRAICDKRQLMATLRQGWLLVWNLRGHAADLSKLQPQLLREIKPGEYVLIIIDPIYKVLGSRDENKAGDIASLLNEIELLAVRTGAAVAFGAHYSKGNQASKEAIDRVGGSGVFARDPDSIVNFTKHQEQDCFTVEMTLRNHAPVEPFVVRWKYPLFNVAGELDPSQLKKSAGAAEKQFHADELAELLTRSMCAAELRELAKDKIGMSDSTFYRLFKELKERGAITPSANGTLWERK
jgi:hypothetical protein